VIRNMLKRKGRPGRGGMKEGGVYKCTGPGAGGTRGGGGGGGVA
jgi:hypothetical protein